MSAIAFDPWAVLKRHRENLLTANAANPQPSSPARLAALAGLAAPHPPTVIVPARFSASSDSVVAIRRFHFPHASDEALVSLAEWQAGVERLATLPSPDSIEPRRWSALKATAARLLHQHGPALEKAGWGTLDLFGLHRHAPTTYAPGWGLAWLLEVDGEVLDLQRNGIAMCHKISGARLVYRRRSPIAGVVPAWTFTDAALKPGEAWSIKTRTLEKSTAVTRSNGSLPMHTSLPLV